MTQSLAFWDILPRSCAYSGPVASSAAALITVPIVSEIQRIVHPPCDVVIRVVHQREQAQSKPGLAAHPCLGKNLRQRVTASARSEQLFLLVDGISLRRNASPPLTARALEAGNPTIVCPRHLASIAIRARMVP